MYEISRLRRLHVPFTLLKAASSLAYRYLALFLDLFHAATAYMRTNHASSMPLYQPQSIPAFVYLGNPWERHYQTPAMTCC